MAAKRTLLIVDDHAVFREGLVRIINQEKDLAVCGEASDGAEALKRAEALRPDLAVVDISLEGAGGLEVVKSLRGRFPDMRVLVLSMHPESLYGERSLRAGANGYVMKREGGRSFLVAVRRVLDGKTHVSRELNELILQRASSPAGAGVESLSNRELEVFQLIGDGFGTRQIAEKLSISMKTDEDRRDPPREHPREARPGRELRPGPAGHPLDAPGEAGLTSANR
jgi:DNA-binding NarL/FixJ family response regulator